MSEISNNKSIKETLNVIKQALQEENVNHIEDDIMMLNQLVNENGTISTIKIDKIHKHEIQKILNEKLSEVFEQYLDKWLNKNIPNYLEKYFSKKEK